MRRFLSLVGIAVLAACGKTAGERQRDVTRCSAASSDALEIELCLESQFGWKEADARPAAAARAHELDSIEAWQADSAWAAGSGRRRGEVRQCAGPDLERCLLVRMGWPEERARAAADSVWAAHAADHRRQAQSCARQRESSVGSCLMLRYKWPPARALAVDDSLQRERMR